MHSSDAAVYSISSVRTPLPAIKARVDLVRNAQLGELPTLLRLAATRISGLLSPTGIARDAGMSRPTVQRYLALLEQLFLLIRARAWSRNIGQRLIKAPKVVAGFGPMDAALNWPAIL
jgi:predicted AAA+ superfamily ATPase